MPLLQSECPPCMQLQILIDFPNTLITDIKINRFWINFDLHSVVAKLFFFYFQVEHVGVVRDCCRTCAFQSCR
jgi:hypothetical protein